jgi:hypothetical protein
MYINMLYGLVVVMTTTLHTKAKEHYDEWIEQGYDGVHLLKIGEEK